MYVKEGEKIAVGLSQLFLNNFSLKVVNKNIIIKMKNDNNITNTDLNICKFLFNVKFATKKQILSIFKTDELQLEKLVKFKVLNKFMLHDGVHDKIEDDALVFYCLDIGGRYLLENYSNYDVTDWFTSENMRTSEQVDKTMTTVDFYIALMQSSGKRLVSFRTEPKLRVGKTTIVPSFDFCLRLDSGVKNFVCEVVKDYDLPVLFTEKITKLESLLKTNGWRKYYIGEETEPILLLITESEKDALLVGQITEQSTKIEKFRLTTIKNFKKPLHEAFLKYQDNQLISVIANTFK